MDSLLSEVVPVDDESRPARPLLLAACGLTQILTLRVAVPPKTVGRKRANDASDPRARNVPAV